MRLSLALLALILSAGVARAEGPAVSELNGKVSVEGGATGQSGQSSAIGTLQGGLTAPLGHSFGVELDGILSDSHGSFSQTGVLQLFWRDPTLALLGPIGAFSNNNGRTLGFAGAQGELYAPNFTAAVVGGYIGTNNIQAPAQNGGFFGGSITLYATPDLALSIGGGGALGLAMGVARAEYLLPDIGVGGRRNIALFVDASAGDRQSYSATAGVRFYFGPEKTLIRRQREDDPFLATRIVSTLAIIAGTELRAFYMSH